MAGGYDSAPGGYVGARPKDLDKLSTKPSQIRNRIRRAHKKAKKTGNWKVYNYELEQLKLYDPDFKPVEEWDFEELAHGKPRNKNGTFVGRAPVWVTPELVKEAKAILHKLTYGKLASHAEAAVGVIYNLMNNDDYDHNGKPVVDARTKLAAAQFIVEHVVGKPTAIVEVSATDETRQAFAAAIVLDDGSPQGHLALPAGEEPIEGEIVEEGDND